MPEHRLEVPLLVAFIDLTRFGAQSQRVSDIDLAETLDTYYERVAVAIEAGGGRLVKFVGDGALAVFGEADVDRGVQALLDLKDSIDELMDTRGWECRLAVKVHFGSAVAGPFGPADAKRFDVIGKTVNTAVTLDSTGVALSVTAFRKLGSELRRRFKKHTPPITYIRHEDPRRVRATVRG
jgi:adenylate cyclase